MYKKTAEITCEITQATLVSGDKGHCVQAFTNDTRSLQPGGTFICFKGEAADGNDYVVQALNRGAKTIVMTRKPTLEEIAKAKAVDAAMLRAHKDDAYSFLQSLASAFRKEEGWLTVAITGSVGKTTTRQMTKVALSSQYNVFSNEGNMNSVIGVPLTILNAPEKQEVFVCEMGMDHQGEIDQIAKVVRPNLACITNIGTAHLGLLGSRENIARAKAELIRWLVKDERACLEPDVEPALFLDCDDEYTSFIEREFAREEGVSVKLLAHDFKESIDAKALYAYTKDIHSDTKGTTSCVYVGSHDESIKVTCPLLGTHMIKDALFAFAFANYLGCDMKRAAAKIEAMEATSMRTEIKKLPCGARLIDDSYNANPVSMTAAIDLLQNMDCAGRKIALLGEMGELGPTAPALHKEIGRYAASSSIDVLIFIGADNAACMYQEALLAGACEEHTFCVASAMDAVQLLSSILISDATKCDATKRDATKEDAFKNASTKRDASKNDASVCEQSSSSSDLILVKGSRFLGLDVIAKEMNAVC